MLLVNLRMDAVYAKENMHIRWVCETGIVENIEQIVKEYKQTRDLLVRSLYLSLGSLFAYAHAWSWTTSPMSYISRRLKLIL